MAEFLEFRCGRGTGDGGGRRYGRRLCVGRFCRGSLTRTRGGRVERGAVVAVSGVGCGRGRRCGSTTIDQQDRNCWP